MGKTAPKRLLDLLLENGVFHQESVFLYSDKSWSFGSIIPDKAIIGIFPIDNLSNRWLEGKPAPLSGYLHAYKTENAEGILEEIKKTLIERRGIDHAFKYYGAENNMRYGAALIAAREPETAVLYNAGAHWHSPRLRIIASPAATLNELYRREAESETAGRCIPRAQNTTVIVAHPLDTAFTYITVHELVHAFDLSMNSISNQISGDTFGHTAQRIKWLQTLRDMWEKEPENMEPGQKQFIQEWSKSLSKLPQRDRPGMEPYTEEQSRAVLQQVLGIVGKLTCLPRDLYPTPEARRAELLPVFEEAVARLSQSRLDPDDEGRKLAELLLPEIGAFDRQHYLPVLKREYEKVCRSGHLAMDGDTIAIPQRPMRPGLIPLPSRVERDRGLTDDERKQITGLRMNLRYRLIRSENFLPQADLQMAMDDVVGQICAFYERKSPHVQAQELAREELDAVRASIARHGDMARF